MNKNEADQASPPNLPRPPRLGPESIGRSAAIVHGGAEWKPTADYVRDRLRMLQQAARHLENALLYIPDAETVRLLQNLLAKAEEDLETCPPEALPFLSTGNHVRRLRICAVMREWLLAARHTRHLDHLKEFLRAYQMHSPLSISEINFMATALRLAVAEKCCRLPSPAESTHMELLPRLASELADTCRLIADTDWQQLGNELTHVQATPVSDLPPRLHGAEST